MRIRWNRVSSGIVRTVAKSIKPRRNDAALSSFNVTPNLSAAARPCVDQQWVARDNDSRKTREQVY